MEDENSSYICSANARSKRKTILKQKRINKENNQQCTPSFNYQAKRRMFTPFCDVTTNILNQESTQNCYEESNEGNSHTYADHTISLRQNLLQKFHIVGSRETIQSHSYLYRGTSSQHNAIPQTESSIGEPVEQNANTLSDDVTEDEIIATVMATDYPSSSAERYDI
ncbi:hypothetical protein DEO72_LG1g3087 [Vigna unguiculata]|uniref:Uncharacterized protein n=1 Tax=Vigna unguiculata TaxID=3917 RepID=A0A4D6KMY9_VIGUN|nr:hypothetical protein DEO72_LG1g3087 [Vigna unguiculata]